MRREALVGQPREALRSKAFSFFSDQGEKFIPMHREALVGQPREEAVSKVSV